MENEEFINKNVIGILGGMGPQASVRLVGMLIDISAKNGAKDDCDFPEIILDSVPVPNFISNSKNLSKVLKILRKRVKLLNNMNISKLAIACNTAHILFKDLQSVSRVPFVSIIEEVVKAVREEKINRVGLLATPSTIRFGLFENALNKFNIKVVIPTEKEREICERIIRNVIAGNKSQSDTLKIKSIASSLKKRRAQGIILGCTEIPLIFPKRFAIPVFDSLEILAKALLRSNNFSSLRKCNEGNTIRS